jgi:hypothetical protein
VLLGCLESLAETSGGRFLVQNERAAPKDGLRFDQIGEMVPS